MRIGFFTERYHPQIDGIIYSIDSFRQELEALGHEVYIFAPAPGFRYKEKNKHVVRFPAFKGLWFEDYMTSVFFPPQAARKIEKLKLDVIHYHTPSQIGLMGAYYAIHNNIPLVTTYHTDLFEYVTHYPAVLPGIIAISLLAPVITGGGMDEYRSSLSSIKPERSVDKWNQKIVERGVTLIHNHCDLVITPSHKIQHQLESWHTKSKIVTLPTGVVKVPTTPEALETVKRRFHLLPDDQIILFVGRLGGEKNVELLMKAFDLIAPKHPKSKLVFAGDGPDREALIREAAAKPHADRIIFTGYLDRPEVGVLYELATVFAFPSLADTQGLVINEAACAGAPVVLVDPEVTDVVKDGLNGLVAKPTPRDFAAKISTILADTKLRQEMSEAGVALAASFTPSQQTSKLLGLYQEVISNHRDRRPNPKASLKFWGFGDS